MQATSLSHALHCVILIEKSTGSHDDTMTVTILATPSHCTPAVTDDVSPLVV